LRKDKENFTLKTGACRQHIMTRRCLPHVVYIFYLTTALKSDITVFVW